MEITVTTSGATATMLMSGRFDFNVHRPFKDAYDPLLLQSGVTTVEVDLAGVEYVDSSALGMLLLLRERAEAQGRKVVLCRSKPPVLQILDIANFGKLFTIR